MFQSILADQYNLKDWAHRYIRSAHHLTYRVLNNEPSRLWVVIAEQVVVQPGFAVCMLPGIAQGLVHQRGAALPALMLLLQQTVSCQRKRVSLMP